MVRQASSRKASNQMELKMDRFHWMFLKAFLPGLGWMVAACLVAWWASGLLNNSMTVGIADALSWGSLAVVGWGVLLLLAASYRLWRWQRGDCPACDCGGLLGRERDGRYGPYRKCLACGRNLNERYYR
jgi:hypothetical protein